MKIIKDATATDYIREERDDEELFRMEFPAEETPKWYGYETNTYNVVAPLAYLIGLTREQYDLTFAQQGDCFDSMQKNKEARIIRNLCILRTSILKNFKNLNFEIKFYLKNLHTLPEYINQFVLQQLRTDGIDIVKANTMPCKYLMEINTHICNHIGNCSNMFPEWLKWEFIRELFIMPKGQTELGIKRCVSFYNEQHNNLPYDYYMNWKFKPSGNILLNDKKFVQLLYSIHNMDFKDFSKVSTADNSTKNNIYEFLNGGARTCIFVDCENADPYKLHATLFNLDKERLLSSVGKIVLIDDANTTPAWQILSQFTEIPVEHLMTERVLQNKSLVDITLAANVCKEFYSGKFDSFILASSDSDYWGLMRSLPDARFLILLESENTGYGNINEMNKNGVTYCYMDDFCTGNSNAIKVAIVLNEMKKILKNQFAMNIKDIYKEARYIARANMLPTEQDQFFDKYLKNAKLHVDKDGNMSIELGA